MAKPKNRIGVVYSTNPDFSFDDEINLEVQTKPWSEQKIRIELDKSGRAGKQVTLISQYVASPSDLDILCKELKNLCGCGGTIKDSQILIQGDNRTKIAQFLENKGAKTKVL